MSLLFQLLANGMVNGALFAVLAVGFGLVYRSTRVFHIAYGAAFVLSGCLFYTLVTAIGLDWWVAGVLTVGLGAFVGWLMEVGFYGPFFRRGTAFGAVMVASLGLGIIIENGLALVYGNETHSIPRALAGSVMLGPVRLTTIQITELVVCGFVLVGLALASRLKFFRVIKALGENGELLQIQGWRLSQYRMLVFALSGALAAVPACLIMVDMGMDVHVGMSYLLLASVAVLAGGVARMSGWVLGGVILAVLQSLVVWKFSAKWMDIVAFALLIVILLSRREGLLGVKRRAEEK
jgi:branched-chain amino acid transport system permease protein